MVIIVRSEPNRIKFLQAYLRVRDELQQVGWLNFFKKFEKHEIEVTKYFSQDFDGVEAEIGDIKIILIKSIMEEATKLPRNGESWFKNMKNRGE